MPENREKGITLVEVLASVVITSIVVMIILHLSGTTMLTTRNNENRHQALLLAEQTLSEIKSHLSSFYPAPPTVAQLTAELSAFHRTNGKYAIQTREAQFPSNQNAPDGNHLTLQMNLLCNTGANQFEPRTIFVIVMWS